MNQCKYCNKRFEYTTRKRRSGYRSTTCSSCSVTRSKRRTKIKAVLSKGGKCQRCGYDKSIAALCFHHLDPSNKDFNLGTKGHTIGWSKVEQEVKKCELLCMNCHAETHEILESKRFPDIKWARSVNG